eukprot:5587581-Prorocentrum_lima.AAC.1
MVSFQGDCLPIVRYCQGNGRIRDPHCHHILADGLRALAGSGLVCRWQLIPRTENSEADSLARAAARTTHHN